jgi:sporulation protein YlmC with PRC-barrel domain
MQLLGGKHNVYGTNARPPCSEDHLSDKEAHMKNTHRLLAAAAAIFVSAIAIDVPAYATSTAQSADEYRTSKLVGSKVYNQANDNIGSVEDIILKPDGSLDSVILSVGGFLGIGNKYVSVPFQSLKVTRDNGSVKVVTDGTKDSLKALPDYQFYKS